MQSKNHNKVAGMVKELSAFPEFMNFNVLAFNSLSLHTSSWNAPRVIVSGPDARFIVTFNGDGNTFEVAEFNAQKTKPEFREVVMKGDGLTHNLLPDEIELETKNFIVSKANPKRCAECHGETYHPIWDTYHTWPGIYGGYDDNPMTADVDGKRESGRFINFKKDIEWAHWLQFKELKSSHPRYRYVPDYNPNYLPGTYTGANSSTHLSHALSSLYARVIAAEFKKPGLMPFRYALLGAYDCDSPTFQQNWIHKKIKQTYATDSKPYKQLQAQTFMSQLDHFYQKVNRMKEDMGRDNIAFGHVVDVQELINGLKNPYFRPPINSRGPTDCRGFPAHGKRQMEPCCPQYHGRTRI